MMPTTQEPPVKVDDTGGQGLRIKVGPVDIPIPRWCIPVFGVIAIIAVAWAMLGQTAQTIYSRYQLGKSEEQDKMEAYKHFADSAKMIATQSDQQYGALEAKLYSDGCVSVTYKGGGLSATVPAPHFIRKIDQPSEPAPGRISQASSPAELAIVAALHAEALAQPRCLNPHPGNFNSSYGQRNGCWVQVFRQFADGCVHYQWLNTCSNAWDVNPDGSPRVYWTQCRH